MNLKAIVEALVLNSSSMSNTFVIEEIFGRLDDNLGLQNRLQKEIEWNRKTVSALLSGRPLPPSLRQSFAFSDFNDMLLDSIHHFYVNNKENIAEEACTEALSDLFANEKERFPKMRNPLEIETFFEKSLFDCLYQFFWESYTNPKIEKTSRKSNKSLFALIISTVLQTSQAEGRVVKHRIAYSLDDKMDVNGIGGGLRGKIGVSFDTYFDAIESTFEFLANKELDIKSRFLNAMAYYYTDFMAWKGIDPDDKENIKKQSADAINYVLTTVMRDVEGREINGCYETEVPMYCFALVVYAFYRCRILIPIEEEKNDH